MEARQVYGLVEAAREHGTYRHSSGATSTASRKNRPAGKITEVTAATFDYRAKSIDKLPAKSSPSVIPLWKRLPRHAFALAAHLPSMFSFESCSSSLHQCRPITGELACRASQVTHLHKGMSIPAAARWLRWRGETGDRREYLRKTHHITGAVSDFRIDDRHEASFKGPEATPPTHLASTAPPVQIELRTAWG